MAQWFENWFDSPYYHKLYFDRDETEAAAFIHKIIDYVKPLPNAYMLDVACGKGRHALTMAQHNYTVTGIDISPSSIAYAKQFETEKLEFFEHDMRLTFRINYYDIAFNLFTSFGYFNTLREHQAALRTIAQSLKPNGLFVMDYLNANYVQQHLQANEIKVIDGTTFTLNKHQTNLHFIKHIKIEDAALPTALDYTEQVATFTLPQFETMFAKQGLVIEQVFGNYNLNAYDSSNSKRLVMVARKKG